jgi:hypothetical protein
MRAIPRLMSTLLLATLMMGASPLVAQAAEPASAAPHLAGAPSPTANKLPEDVNRKQLRYAEREAQNPKSADFHGAGSGVYISGSAVVIVLLIVLLVVLL